MYEQTNQMWCLDERYECKTGHVWGRVAFEGRLQMGIMEDFDQGHSYVEGREETTLMGAIEGLRGGRNWVWGLDGVEAGKERQSLRLVQTVGEGTMELAHFDAPVNLTGPQN